MSCMHNVHVGDGEVCSLNETTLLTSYVSLTCPILLRISPTTSSRVLTHIWREGDGRDGERGRRWRDGENKGDGGMEGEREMEGRREGRKDREGEARSRGREGGREREKRWEGGGGEEGRERDSSLSYLV